VLTVCSLLAAISLVGDYHGYQRTDFKLDRYDAVLVAPKTPAKGRPWIWRTEFFDHRPELDLALLENGFHLAYLDVQNEYGSPGAIYQYDRFYRHLITDQKLSPKVVLEGFSRGGLSAYNWAAANPDKVMAIYADAPVCDFRSWPRKHSAQDWTQLMKAYGFPTEQDALDYPFGPLGKLEVLAKARVPLIHVVGSADEVVPVSENTDLLERAYRRLGGTIKVIRKPGVGHHPHSLDDPRPIVEFILKNQGNSRNAPPATTIPAPNPESRYLSAGWRASWLQQHSDSIQASRANPRLVLIGDSITQGWGGPGRNVGAVAGDAYAKHLAPFSAVNMGMSGDRTQHLLWRIDHGALDHCQPEAVAILIGVNNLNSDTPAAIVRGVEAIALKVRRKQPKAKVILHALFPVGQTSADPRRALVQEVNTGLATLAKKHRYQWLDLTSDFTQTDGSVNPARMAPDALHLAQGGYDIWGQRLSQILK